MATLLAHVPSAIAVYRSGSSVTGLARHDSDIDVALLADHPLGTMERFELQERLAFRLRVDVDLGQVSPLLRGRW